MRSKKPKTEALEESKKQINNLANSVKIIAETKQHMVHSV